MQFTIKNEENNRKSKKNLDKSQELFENCKRIIQRTKDKSRYSSELTQI